MKRARVIHEGRVRTATEDSGAILLDGGKRVAEDGLTWLPPVDARTIFALGLNYRDHAAELDFRAPDQPLVFLKTPGALTGHCGHTQRPDGIAFMHFECELAVVIGRAGRRIAAGNAQDHIAGYTIANDYAVRDYLENYYRPNLRVKNRDAATPLGPWLVDAADVPDPQELALRTYLNGKAVQEGNTRDMIFKVSHLVEYLSEFMTLSPGDVILTGTPKGVADCRIGDEVVAEIEGLGRLLNTIVAETGCDLRDRAA